MIEQFRNDVDTGLSAPQKHLPSEYFYDEIGDDLFRQIMALPEYYLTRAEYEIFSNKTHSLIEALGVSKDAFFEIVELGPGDGLKSICLLKVLLEEGYDFAYYPIDISRNALDILEQELDREISDLQVHSRQGHYVEALATLKHSSHRKVVLFLGSNIGNLDDETAADFLYKLGACIRQGDMLLLGADLKKSSDIVLPAYNDASGVTAEFNLNLLRRINRDLDANFNLDHFEHRPVYLETEGLAKSYLVSLVEQDVYIGSLDKTYSFAENESIQTEMSRKYDDDSIRRLINETDFVLDSRITDSRQYFADYILRRL